MTDRQPSREDCAAFRAARLADEAAPEFRNQTPYCAWDEAYRAARAVYESATLELWDDWQQTRVLATRAAHKAAQAYRNSETG